MNKLKMFRERKNLSIDQLVEKLNEVFKRNADELGLKEPYSIDSENYKYYEEKNRIPPVRELNALSEVLEFDSWELFDDDDF